MLTKLKINCELWPHVEQQIHWHLVKGQSWAQVLGQVEDQIWGQVHWQLEAYIKESF